MRTFNTAGPIRPDEHYHIPPLERWDMDEIRCLIREKRYFVLHAPRQTGKTSCLLALMERLNAEADYTALYGTWSPPRRRARMSQRVCARLPAGLPKMPVVTWVIGDHGSGSGTRCVNPVPTVPCGGCLLSRWSEGE